MCTTFWLAATPSPALKGNFISICKSIALMIGMDKKTVLIRRRYVQMYICVRLRCTFDCFKCMFDVHL